MTELNSYLDKDAAEYVAWSGKKLRDEGRTAEASSVEAETEYLIDLFKKIDDSHMIKSLYESVYINSRFEGYTRLTKGIQKLTSWTPLQRFNTYSEGPDTSIPDELVLHAVDTIALGMAERELGLRQHARTALLSPAYMSTSVVSSRDMANRSIYRMGKLLGLATGDLTQDQSISANLRGVNVTLNVGVSDNAPLGFTAIRHGRLTVTGEQVVRKAVRPKIFGLGPQLGPGF